MDVHYDFELLQDQGNLAKKRELEMMDIYRMSCVVPVRAAFDFVESMIQIQDISINEGDTHYNTPTMKRYIKDHIVPFMYATLKYFFNFGFIPYHLVKKKIYCGDDPIQQKIHGNPYISMLVPIPVPVGKFSVTPTINDHGEKDIHVNAKYNPDDVKVILSRKNKFRGPNIHDHKFDTKCGALVDEWRILDQKERIELSVILKQATPEVWIRQDISSTMKSNVDAAQTFEAINAGIHVDQAGYAVKAPVEVVRDKDIARLPAQYTTAPFQPQPSLAVDIERARQNFRASTAAAFTIDPKKLNASSDNNLISHQTDSMVDESRASVCAMLESTIDDLNYAAQDLWAIIFKEVEVPLTIPFRTQAGHDTLFKFHEKGILDDDVMRRKVISMIGIHPNEATKGPLHRPHVSDHSDAHEEHANTKVVEKGPDTGKTKTKADHEEDEDKPDKDKEEDKPNPKKARKGDHK
jgi:hypothetical protein